MALVHLTRGDVRSAAASITVALAEEPWDCRARGRLLPAQVQIAIANDDHETARAAAAELAQIATKYARPGLSAAAECARAAVLLAAGQPATAAGLLRRGILLWREAGAPYEAARARLLLAEALEQQGDAKHALIEMDAARGAAFASLNTPLDPAPLLAAASDEDDGVTFADDVR